MSSKWCLIPGQRTSQKGNQDFGASGLILGSTSFSARGQAIRFQESVAAFWTSIVVDSNLDIDPTSDELVAPATGSMDTEMIYAVFIPPAVAS